MAALHCLPLEVAHHALTFAGVQDVAAVSKADHFLADVAGDDRLWALLLARDFSGRDHYSLAEPDRRLKDVYQMTKTRRYKERTFDERPLPQRAAIVVSSVLLAPVIFIYLTPRIARGLHRSVWRPSVALWLAIAREQELLRRPAVDPATRSWAYQCRQPPPPRFLDLPWYQKLGVLLTSAPMSPFLALMYVRKFVWKTLPRLLVRFAKWAHRAVLLPLWAEVLSPALQWTQTKVVLAVAVFEVQVVQPAVGIAKQSLRVGRRGAASLGHRTWQLGSWTSHRVLAPAGRAACEAWTQSTAFAYHRVLCPGASAALDGVRLGGKLLHFLCTLAVDGFLEVGEVCTTAWGFLLQRVVWPAAAAVRRQSTSGGQRMRQLLRRLRAAAGAAVGAGGRGARWGWEAALLPAAQLLAVSVRFGAIFGYERLLVPVGRGLRWTALTVVVPTVRATAKGVLITAHATAQLVRALALGVRLGAAFTYDKVLLPLGRGLRWASVTTATAIFQGLLVPASKACQTAARGTAQLVRALALGVRLGAALTYDKVLLPLGRGLRWAGVTMTAAVCDYVVVPAAIVCVLAARGTAQLVRALALGVRLGAAFTYDKVLLPLGRGLRWAGVTTVLVLAEVGRTAVTAVDVVLVKPTLAAWPVTCHAANATAGLARDTASFVVVAVLLPCGHAVRQGVAAGGRAVVVTASFTGQLCLQGWQASVVTAQSSAALLTAHVIGPAAAVATAAATEVKGGLQALAGAVVDGGCCAVRTVQTAVVYPAVDQLAALEGWAVRTAHQTWDAMCDFLTWLSRSPQKTSF